MSNRLLVELESKIDDVIETIEIMRLQIEELEEKNAALEAENVLFKNRQAEWEQGLTTLLNKLDDISPATEDVEERSVESFAYTD